MDKYQQAKESLSQYFGFSDFRESQKDVISTFLSGRDVLAVMPTGGGKSICYQVPALITKGVCVVISPIISLMYDQVEALKRKGIKAAFINSTMEKDDQARVINQMINEEIKFIYISPERLKSFDFMEALKRTRISFIAVDEAHCVSQWGHEFRVEYSKISKHITILERSPQKKGKKIQMIALTATATPEVRDEIVELLNLKEPAVIVKGFERSNLSFHVHHPSSKRDSMLSLIRKHEGKPTIVYFSTRKTLNNELNFLRSVGVDVGAYHGGMTKENRQQSQDDFLNNNFTTMLATNAFGMGVDKPDVRCVIHYECPDSMESYYQEAGRAGRDEKMAECHLLYSPYDRRLHEFLMDATNPPQTVLRSFKDLIDIWGNDYFNQSAESLKIAIPSFKDSMLSSIYRILEEEGVVKITKIQEFDGIHEVVEIVDRNVSIEDRLNDIKKRRIAKMRLIEVMERYSQGISCLRNFMLNYFGEIKKEPCGQCSTCINTYVTLENKNDYSEQATICIDTIKESPFKMKKDTLHKILYGIADVSTLSLNAYKLDNFGALSYMGEDRVVDFINFLIEEQYLVYNGMIEEYIYISNKGNKVARGDGYIYIEKGKFKTKGDIDKTIVNISQRVADLQEELAKEEHVSKFMIWTPLTTKSLIEIKPKTLEELQNVKGLSQTKVEMFGERIIEIFNE